MSETVRRIVLLLLLAAAGLIAYSNSFSGVFLFDDTIRIVEEKRIRQLWPLGPLLSGERPVVDLSLAVNFALGGLDPWGYHAFNLAVHILAGITLFGIMRRTLGLAAASPFGPVGGVANGENPPDVVSQRVRPADWLAFAVALLFVIHPLQTQSVTYIIQRGESMMGLLYLLTLYCAIRAAQTSRVPIPGPPEFEDQKTAGPGKEVGSRHHPTPKSSGWWFWAIAAVATCALGMATKAVMVTAPVMVMIYDRVFFRTVGPEGVRAQRRPWALYGGLCATWAVLWLCGIGPEVLGQEQASTNVGFAYRGISPLAYAATQPGVILKYLQLSIWPVSLSLDYDWPPATNWRQVVPPALVVFLLLCGTAWGVWRRHWLGFLGAWFFVILAPTSSFVPVKDLMFEHRCYLPLAAVIATVVLPLGAWILHRTRQGRPRHFAIALLLVAAPLIYATHRRNDDYRSELAMWQDVAAKRPYNARAHLGIGVELLKAGRVEESIALFRRAIELKHAYADAHLNLGIALARAGRHHDAIEAFAQATQLDPRKTYAYENMARSQSAVGDFSAAAVSLGQAIRLDPLNAVYHYQLGNAAADGGNIEAAIVHFQQALTLDPGHFDARINLGNAFLALGRLKEAQKEYLTVLQAKPGDSLARVNYGRTLAQQGRFAEALAEFARVAPGDPLESEARYGAGLTLARMDRGEEAIAQLEEVLRLAPDHAGARQALASLKKPRQPASH